MHLLRVQVPDFRVLKDVDISFEKDFKPNVFPLGSQNGGGKSTLLQLIFVLLHCSTKPERLPYLKNFLSGFNLPEGEEKRVLAIIDIWDGEKTIELEFFSCSSHFTNLILNQHQEEHTLTSAIKDLKDLRKRKSELSQNITELNSVWKKIQSIDANQSSGKFGIISNFQISGIMAPKTPREEAVAQLVKLLSKLGIAFSKRDATDADLMKEIKMKSSQTLVKAIRDLDDRDDMLSGFVNKLTQDLKSQNLIHIVDFSSSNNLNGENEIFLCHVKNLDLEEPKKFLDDFSKKVFLAAPSTQVFLFLSLQDRKSLFTDQNATYHNSLRKANSNLHGLFTYDFLAVDILIDSFKVARDQDFKEAIKTGGEYGSNYKILLNDLNTLMINKYVNLTSDFTGITFKLDKPNGDVEIYPEDLSHGELKRLSIYMWLKHLNIEDAIVLMDEVDIALHPDWQYRIVDDLTEWAPSNQYILATHSYELCQALTPSHVKVLEPRLTERPNK